MSSTYRSSTPRQPPLNLTEPWGGIGQVTELGDGAGAIHWVDFPAGPSADAATPPLVLVHGLGGSHLNWVQVAPQLSADRDVFVVDLPGFGLTEGAGRDTSVGANAGIVARFLREVVGRPAVLVGNSMGGMISSIVSSRHPDLVDALVLVDAALPAGAERLDPLVALQFGLFSLPMLGEATVRKMSSYSDEERVRGMTTMCFADPSRGDARVFEAAVELSRHRRTFHDADHDFLVAARSLLRVLRGSRRYAAALRNLSMPVLVVHGDRDRLVHHGHARRVAAQNPTWSSHTFEGVGHTPQLEVPEDFVAVVGAWIEEHAPTRTV